jgi:hypothetical protein
MVVLQLNGGWVSDRLWWVDDIAALIERREAMEDGSLLVG